MFQVLWEASPDQEEGPYVLIQRAWLEEDDGAASRIYVETQDDRLCGPYATLEVELLRNRLTRQLPPPADETIEIDFKTPDRTFQELQRILGIIVQDDLGGEAEKRAD